MGKSGSRNHNCWSRNGSLLALAPVPMYPATLSETVEAQLFNHEVLRVNQPVWDCSFISSMLLSSSATNMSSHLFAMYSLTASTPMFTISIGGMTNGFWSKLSLVSLSSRPNVSGRAWIWLLLRSSSLRLIRSPIVSGSSVRSLKLLLTFKISRFVNLPIAGGRPQSSLKWASKWRKDLISQMDVGREQSLLRWTKSFCKFTSSYPMLVGKYTSSLKLASNSTNDLCIEI